MEPMGLEPTTSCMPCRRAPSCAMTPYAKKDTLFSPFFQGLFHGFRIACRTYTNKLPNRSVLRTPAILKRYSQLAVLPSVVQLYCSYRLPFRKCLSPGNRACRGEALPEGAYSIKRRSPGQVHRGRYYEKNLFSSAATTLFVRFHDNTEK